MFKNTIIALLSTALLFSNEAYSSMLDPFVFLSVAAFAFAIVCTIEDAITEAWNKRMQKVGHLEKFKKEVKKISQHLPTKAIS